MAWATSLSSTYFRHLLILTPLSSPASTLRSRLHCPVQSRAIPCTEYLASTCKFRVRSSRRTNNASDESTAIGSSSSSKSTVGIDCIGTAIDVECVVNPNQVFDDEKLERGLKEVLPKVGPFFVAGFRLIPAGPLISTSLSSPASTLRSRLHCPVQSRAIPWCPVSWFKSFPVSKTLYPIGAQFKNFQFLSTRVYGFCWVRSYSAQSSKFTEYEMPSVTWGVVQGRKEKLVSKVIICDYLKGLGIITDELEDFELPSTIDVMRERVEFLQKLGLTIDDINEYPLMLGCSLRKNMIPVLGYLEKIGIPKSKLGEFVKSYPQVLHASVVVELVPVVKFLRGLDVEKVDVGYVLQRYPELLAFKLEGTMSTSVAYLVSIGVNPRDIGPMVTQYPFFLGMRVGTVIKPLVDYLVSLGLQKKILARMLEKRPYVMGYDLEEIVKSNVECLISFGVRREAIPSVIAQYPQILGLPLKEKMSSQQYFLNLKLKIDPDGFAQIVERMPQIVSLNQHVIMKPIEFLLGRGIAVGDVGMMLVRCPQLFALQVGMMKNSFYFYKTEMGRPMRELVEFPEYFTYSLESRIKPRYKRLQNKGIRFSLAWFLNCSDQRFEERLEGDYIEAESSGPSFYMGGKLELPGNDVVTDEEDESDDEVLYRRTVSL